MAPLENGSKFIICSLLLIVGISFGLIVGHMVGTNNSTSDIVLLTATEDDIDDLGGINWGRFKSKLSNAANVAINVVPLYLFAKGKLAARAAARAAPALERAAPGMERGAEMLAKVAK